MLLALVGYMFVLGIGSGLLLGRPGEWFERTVTVELESTADGSGPARGVLVPPEQSVDLSSEAGLGVAGKNADDLDLDPAGSVVAGAATFEAFDRVADSSSDPVNLAALDQSLLEQGPSGPLPRIGDEGRQPWNVYARPFDESDTRPRVTLIVVDLGLSTPATEATISKLPGAVTLAFTPYASDPEKWVPLARGRGHEILLSLPLESSAFPFRDPGPYALLTRHSSDENLERLQFVLGRIQGYVGVLGVGGSAFARDREGLRPVLMDLRNRGLMYVDGSEDGAKTAVEVAAKIDLPHASADLVLDEEPSSTAIDQALQRLEALAHERFVAVAVAHPYPVTLERIAAWLATLDTKNIVLAPVSATANRQMLP